MEYKITLLPSAYEDIDKIFEYICNVLQNPQAAVSLINKIYKETDPLKTLPYIGAEIDIDISLKYTYRKLHVENYIVFYIVNEEEKSVDIIRVLYGKSNYIKQLNI